jgi:ABC-2 type transport system ATP-binding protein
VLLEIEHLTKQYRRGVLANDDISLGVDAGEVFGLLGPNGAGKTTLISQILGVAAPTSGAISIDGVDVVRSPAVARQSCSYQPQSGAPVVGLSPREAIDLAGRLRGGDRTTVRRRADELITALELDEWATKVTQLSGGVTRLVGFCMAAVVPGRIVILDEPTNDIDPLRRKRLWEQVRALADAGAAVLLVTHNVLEAERCVDRLAIVDHGRVLAHGTPAALKSELGAALRLELVLEPGADAPPLTRSGSPVTVGRRLFMDIEMADAGAAVAWAKELTDGKTIAEFYLGPASLEDVYVRRVQPATSAQEDSHAAIVG